MATTPRLMYFCQSANSESFHPKRVILKTPRYFRLWHRGTPEHASGCIIDSLDKVYPMLLSCPRLPDRIKLILGSLLTPDLYNLLQF